MSPAGQGLRKTIETVRRRVRRDGVLAVLGTVCAGVPLCLIIAWALGAGRFWQAPSTAPLVLEAVFLAAAVGCGVLLGRRWIAAVDEEQVAAATESSRKLPPGSVRGVLELGRELPTGTSPALFRRAEAEVAKTLVGARPEELAGELGVRARVRRRRALLALGSVSMLAVLLGFVSPERSRSGWGPLLNPVAHLNPPPLPALEVEPGNAEVMRGGALDVRVRAPGRDRVILRWRKAGDIPRQRTLAVAEASAVTRLAQIDAEVRYWVVAPDGAASDTFAIRPLDPLLVSDLVVDVVYPAYLKRQTERFEGEVPPLEVPAGTALQIRGRTTRLLEAAGLVRAGGDEDVVLEVAADRFEGRWTPRASGVYDWVLTDTRGGSPEVTPPPLELTLVPDSAPEVVVTYPGVDTVLSAEMRQPVAAQARDDHGIRAASIVSWRVSSVGDRDEPVEAPLPLEGQPERAALRSILDANDRRLLPGDTLYYYVQVVDNSPGRQVAKSEVYRLRIPGMEELRRRAVDEAGAMMDEANSLARFARELEEQTRNLARSASRRGGGGGSARRRNAGGQPGQSGASGKEGSLEYEDAERAKQVLKTQEEMLKRVEELRRQAREMEKAMEAAGLKDPELQKRLSELQDLYNQMMTPELREKLSELREALEALDPERVQKALEELAKEQEQFRERVERSLELLRRAAVEQQMNSLAQEARELSTQQKALAESMKESERPTAEQAEQQEELSQKTDALNKALEKLKQQLARQGEHGTAERTGEAQKQSETAQKAMEQAAEQARRQEGGEAAKSGGQAASELEKAAEQLESAREQMAEAWRQEVQQAVDQATNDALELAERQNALHEQMKQAQENGLQPPRPPQLPQPQLPQPQLGKTKGQQGQQGQKGQQSSSGQSQAGAQANSSSGKQGAQQQGAQQQGGGGEQQGQAQQQGGGKGGQSQAQKQGGGQGGQSQAQQQGQGQGGQGQSSQQGSGQSGQPQDGAQGGQGGRAGGQPGQSSDGISSMRAEQSAVKQGLEALGRNLSEAGERSALLNRDVGAALGRAMLSMQEALEALQEARNAGQLPVQETGKAVEALNRLALELLENREQIQQAESGTGLQEAMERLAELAKQQGQLNGQANSLLPLDLGPRAMSRQLQNLARQQREIAKKLGGVNEMVGGKEDVLGRLDKLAKDAEQLARDMEGGRLTPEMLARQERLFHRLLDAGRTLERDEVSEQRVAERPGDVGPANAMPLDTAVVEGGPRFPVPGPEQLRGLPPAYRTLILDYFDRLNRPEDTNEPREDR